MGGEFDSCPRRAIRGNSHMRRKNVLRTSGVAAAVILLSGCALPPIVTVASIAVDVASYVATGKMVSDHGLSFVMQQDCAMLRVLDDEKPVCVEEDEATASNASKDADEPGRVRAYRPGDPADVQEEANRVMAFYPVDPADAEARRKMEAEVDLGYPMSAGVSVRLPAADRLFHDAAYLVAGVRPASPVPAGSQWSSIAAYREKNRDRISERLKSWRKRNQAAVKAYQKHWRADNIEHVLECATEYRRDKPEVKRVSADRPADTF